MQARSRLVSGLLEWYEGNGRHDLPWRRDQDPYHVLVSELMLQQTQVPRVIPKYEAFLQKFPDVHALAKAPRAEVLRAWQGLGYNSRALRLHALAQHISERKGDFPKERDALLALPGIGPYTAGAIRIFAFDEPDLSVDVNVRRVLTRVAYPTTVTPSKKEVDELALDLIARSEDPHAWHSALMDLGSTICTAKSPSCSVCPLLRECKSKGARPDEIRSQPKQSKFHGSNRWWRGRVLRALLDGKSMSGKELPQQILERDPTREERRACDSAIAQLVEEGIAKQRRDNVLLAGE
jgi:A/G-specific adenine glycosylase